MSVVAAMIVAVAVVLCVCVVQWHVATPYVAIRFGAKHRPYPVVNKKITV